MFYGWLLKIAYRNRKIDVMQLSLSLFLQLLWRGGGTEDTSIINQLYAWLRETTSSDKDTVMKRELEPLSDAECTILRLLVTGTDRPTSTTFSDAKSVKRARNAEYQRQYRLRQKERKVFITDDEQPTTSTAISGIERENRARNAEKQRQYRLRQKERKVFITDGKQPTTSTAISGIEREKRARKTEYARQYRLLQKEKRDAELQKEMMDSDSEVDYVDATAAFKRNFIDNPLGHVCDVCDRICFLSDLKDVPQNSIELLAIEFPDCNVRSFRACASCYTALGGGRIPQLSKSNGFVYPEYPAHLPPLDCITERLISPRLPFIPIRRLRHVHGSKAIFGQLINIPVDVNNMVTQLPRQLDDDYAFNVHIKRHLIHKSSYLQGYVKKSTVKQWLQYLLNKPLYKQKNQNQCTYMINLHTQVGTSDLH